jgi:outer membrane receptor protein involved in Fe transport
VIFLVACVLATVLDPLPTLTGRVVDSSGAPVTAAVHEGGEDGPVAATTDERGRFSIERPLTSTRVTIVAPGFAPVTIPIEPGTRAPDVQVTVQPATLAEQVTVTAGRRELRGVDTPAASSVISSSELLSEAALAPDDALRHTPGFGLFRRSSSRAANPTTQGVTLRGLSASGASRALVLAGGVPLNDPFGGWVYWGRVPQAAIDRLEVVRGAASDLYGADAVGGIVQIVPVGASRSSARASVEGGSLETGRVSLFGAWRSGRVGASAAAEWLSTEGAPIVAEEVRGPVDTPAGVEHGSILGGLEWQATRQTQIELRVQGFGEDRQNGTPLQTNDTNQRQAIVRASGGAFSGQWQAAAYASDQTYDQSFSAVSADRTTETLTQRQRVPSDMTGGGADWVRTWGRTTLLGGTELRRVTGKTTETRYVAGQPQSPTTAGGDQRAIAGFAQVTFAPHPAITLLGGLRLDDWESHTRQPLDEVRGQLYTSGRAALMWQLSAGTSLRGSAYRAIRSPTLNELHRNFRVGDTVTLANTALEAERLAGGEFSWLWARPSRTWRATAFVGELNDAIANVTLSVTPALTTRQRQNAGSVWSRGVELEGDWRPAERWGITGNVAVTRATFGTGPLDGLDVPQVPRYQAGVSARFVDARWLTASVQVRALGRQYEDDRNTLTIGRAAIVDVFASRTLVRQLTAFVAAENVLDAEVPVGRTPVPTVGLPRSVRIGVRAFWR